MRPLAIKNARSLRRSLPFNLGMILLAMVLSVPACSDRDQSPEYQPLEATDTASSTPSSVAATAEPSAEPTLTPTAPAAGIEPEFELLEEPETRYISAAGTGIPMRSTCLGEPRSGDPWSDGTQVTVTAAGVGRCEGWSVAESGNRITWLENRFLADAPPSVQSAPGAPANTPIPRPTTNPVQRPSPTLTATPPRPTPTPTTPTPTAPTPTPTPTNTPIAGPPDTRPDTVRHLPAPLGARVINAQLSGFATIDGDPIVPTWRNCESKPPHHGWGLLDGESVTVVGEGIGNCATWWLVQARGVEFFVSSSFLAMTPP